MAGPFARLARRWSQPAAFCLCSGNSGSHYIVELLRANGCPRCHHEMDPDLFDLAMPAYHHLVGRGELVQALRKTRRGVWFEANNRLFAMAPAIRVAFPRSRFIFLHRDGREQVSSSMRLPGVDAYFRDHPWDLKGLTGTRGQDAFATACHFWRVMNARIADDLAGLEHLSLSLGDLAAGRLEALEAFLGRPLAVRRLPPANTGEARGQAAFPSYEEWPATRQAQFWDICGDEMLRLGYRDRRAEPCDSAPAPRRTPAAPRPAAPE